MQFHVYPNKTSLLNLCREPGTGGTILATLPQSIDVEKRRAEKYYLPSRFVAPGLLEELDADDWLFHSNIGLTFSQYWVRRSPKPEADQAC